MDETLTRAEREKRNNIAYWLPILQQAGIRVPETEILSTEINLLPLLDGEVPDGFEEFVAQIRGACDRFGYPCFLRTGHLAGKHEWDRTCHVADPGRVGHHVAALVEQSAIADLIGLPCRTWAVRKWLKLQVGFHAFRGKMPVAREFRVFLVGGEVQCIHPYWPPRSIWGASVVDWEHGLAGMSEITPTAIGAAEMMAGRLRGLLPGDWSLDIAPEASGRWCAIDMALAEDSFHWPECRFNPGVAATFDDVILHSRVTLTGPSISEIGGE